MEQYQEFFSIDPILQDQCSHKRNTCYYKVQHLDRIYHFRHLSFHHNI
nr:MAG TPA: hypothetical protein [Caudoviricetes sp.]